jgi:hypothetical protein
MSVLLVLAIIAGIVLTIGCVLAALIDFVRNLATRRSSREAAAHFSGSGSPVRRIPQTRTPLPQTPTRYIKTAKQMRPPSTGMAKAVGGSLLWAVLLPGAIFAAPVLMFKPTLRIATDTIMERKRAMEAESQDSSE